MGSDKKIGWRCPTNDAGEGFGFNESGMEYFSGDPFSAIAREITQNTNDAVKEHPAYLEFRQIRVPKRDFPNRECFVEILEKCRIAAQDEDKKAIKFFENALAKIKDEEITFLVARDRNTTGIPGPCKKGTSYHAFMKSTGTSKKADITSGGSFGIGKNAPYAVSDFRTIFLLTNYKDGAGNLQQLVQGKSILMSHEKNGTEFTNNAYWGVKEGFGPLVGDSSAIPKWMLDPFNKEAVEQAPGTSIFVAGFRSTRDWDKIITAYIIQNFFGAILTGKLVVEVGDYRIDKTTLADLFADQEIEKAVSEYPNQPDSLKDSRNYFECMDSDETIHETSQQPHLGKTNIGILLGEQYPKKVAFIRNGMLITDNLHRLQRFPGMKNFVAVVDCKNKTGSELLKQMEPPRHNDFQPERLATESDREKGRRALKNLAELVRKYLNEHARNPVKDKVNLDELSELLGSDVAGEDAVKNGEINPLGKIVLAARPKSNKNRNQKSETTAKGLGEGFDETGKGGDLDDNGGGGGNGAVPSGIGDKGGVGVGDDPAGDGNQPGKNEGGKVKSPTPLSLHNVRGIRLGSKERRIFFTPPIDAKIQLIFERVGADMNLPLEIQSVTNGSKINEITIELEVVKMIKIKLDVTFKYDFEGAVKVVANAL